MRTILQRIKRGILRRTDARGTLRQCPICSWHGRQFAPGGSGTKRRYDCRCPRCGAVERHRLAFLVAEKLVRLDYAAVLHVAPEQELAKWMRSKAGDYLSIDLHAGAMARMDITDLALKDNSRSLIWISHVLEHVEDDRKAIAEIHRVLAPNGIALVQVPIWTQRTVEDRTKTSPEERLAAFYQADHVRLYGLDITERFERAGFSSRITRAQDFGPEMVLTHGLSFPSTNEVFLFQRT